MVVMTIICLSHQVYFRFKLVVLSLRITNYSMNLASNMNLSVSSKNGVSQYTYPTIHIPSVHIRQDTFVQKSSFYFNGAVKIHGCESGFLFKVKFY